MKYSLLAIDLQNDFATEGADHYKATKEAKDMVIDSALNNWGDVIHWEELKGKL